MNDIPEIKLTVREVRLLVELAWSIEPESITSKEKASEAEIRALMYRIRAELVQGGDARISVVESRHSAQDA